MGTEDQKMPMGRDRRLSQLPNRIMSGSVAAVNAGTRDAGARVRSASAGSFH
jgi:hypothetical protein